MPTLSSTTIADAARLAELRAEIRRALHRAPGNGWVEVALSDCPYGCKIHARRRGVVPEAAVHHSRVYGCPAGGRVVRLRLRPVAPARARAAA